MHRMRVFICTVRQRSFEAAIDEFKEERIGEKNWGYIGQTPHLREVPKSEKLFKYPNNCYSKVCRLSTKHTLLN